MPHDYPNDADGDALRRLAADGADMDAPMEIDFFVAAPNELAAEEIADAAEQADFDTEIHQDDESGAWTVICTAEMLATYETILAAQKRLDQLAVPYEGFADGWGTFGNAEDDVDDADDADEAP